MPGFIPQKEVNCRAATGASRGIVNGSLGWARQSFVLLITTHTLFLLLGHPLFFRSLSTVTIEYSFASALHCASLVVSFAVNSSALPLRSSLSFRSPVISSFFHTLSQSFVRPSPKSGTHTDLGNARRLSVLLSFSPRKTRYFHSTRSLRRNVCARGRRRNSETAPRYRFGFGLPVFIY